MLKRLWEWFFPPRTPEETVAHQDAEADRAEARDKWLADEGRQSRQSS